MRTRIRRTIADWLTRDPPRRAFWEGAFADLDAARIGTIHSLCAQILREHPVEAARLDVMPGFGVLEEGRAAVLCSRAVEEALAWAADHEVASHLFRTLREFGLRTVVSTLLEKRLDGMLGEPVAVNYLSRKLGAYDKLTIVPIRERKELALASYIGAPKNDWGLRVITRIDEILRQAIRRDRFMDYQGKWVPNSLKREFRERYDSLVFQPALHR